MLVLVGKYCIVDVSLFRCKPYDFCSMVGKNVSMVGISTCVGHWCSQESLACTLDWEFREQGLHRWEWGWWVTGW